MPASQHTELLPQNQYNLLMQAPVAIAVYRGPDYVIEMANARMLELWDKSQTEVWNKPVFEAMPDLKNQGFEDLMDKVMYSGNSLVIQEIPVVINRKGAPQRLFIKVSYEPLRENGIVNGVMVMAHDITDLVEAKFALEQSEEEFAKVYMESPMGMTILKGEGFVIEKANTMMLSRFWRKTASEVKGRQLVEVFPELKGQKYPELLRKVFVTGIRHREIESPVTINTGTGIHHFYVDFEYTPLTDTDKHVTGIMVTAYDVTERVEARQLIEEAEQRSRLAIEATGMGTFDWDLRTQEFEYSDRLAAIFGGKSRTDFSHQDMVNLIHPDDLHIRHSAVKNAYSNGSLQYSVRLIWPDKSIHWISVYGKIFYEDGHTPVRMYGTAVDISRERQYQKSIEESELKFRSLANFLPTFIWTTDHEGRLTYFNKAILEFSGLSQHEMEQGGWFQLLHPDDRANSIRKLEKAILSGSDFQAELRFKNKEGEYRWQLGRSVSVKNDAGEIQSWIGTSIDIHDQKLMAEELEKRVNARTAELKKANEELVRTNQDLEQFAYVSSHDLQEPLRKIQTFSDLVMKKIGHSQDDVRIHLEKINSSANRMSVLITDLLNYSRVSKSDENFVVLNLNRVLENILSDFEVLIKQKDAVINAGKLPVIKGIPIQINQLFYNLVSNALKFSAEKPVITITAEQVAGTKLPERLVLNADKTYSVIRVKDNGIGFDQVYATQIFTIFQRLNNRAHYSGTGIGLAICKKIAENHGGHIEAESKPGEGAEFTVYLAMQ